MNDDCLTIFINSTIFFNFSNTSLVVYVKTSLLYLNQNYSPFCDKCISIPKDAERYQDLKESPPPGEGPRFKMV